MRAAHAASARRPPPAMASSWAARRLPAREAAAWRWGPGLCAHAPGPALHARVPLGAGLGMFVVGKRPGSGFGDPRNAGWARTASAWVTNFLPHGDACLPSRWICGAAPRPPRPPTPCGRVPPRWDCALVRLQPCSAGTRWDGLIVAGTFWSAYAVSGVVLIS